MFKLIEKETNFVHPVSYPSEKLAIDAEEDICYAMLEAGIEPPTIEIWEIGLDGERIRKVQCYC